MPNPAQTTILAGLHEQNRPNSFVPKKAMLWHDSIIDDMFANPGTTIKATAERLGRSPVTVGYIVNSDLFKARYAQRRDQFNEDLDTRLIGKLAKVAELSLDLTMEQLEKKRTAVPLPLLNDIMSKSLDRLGYGPKPTNPSVQVNVQQNNGAQAQIATPVSASVLEEARASLRQVEQSRSQIAPVAAHNDLLIEHSSEDAAPSRVTEGGGPSEDSL